MKPVNVVLRRLRLEGLDRPQNLVALLLVGLVLLVFTLIQHRSTDPCFGLSREAYLSAIGFEAGGSEDDALQQLAGTAQGQVVLDRLGKCKK